MLSSVSATFFLLFVLVAPMVMRTDARTEVAIEKNWRCNSQLLFKNAKQLADNLEPQTMTRNKYMRWDSARPWRFAFLLAAGGVLLFLALVTSHIPL